MRKIAIAAGAAALLIAGAQSAAAETIKIPLHNWSSQLVGARIVGKMLEMLGEKVDYVSADSQVVYTSMCEGDIHLVHEVWQGAFGVSYEKQLNKGCVITANTHEAKTREEWWYPEYVEKACPGLPDWKALNKCAAMFATASTKPKGRFLAGPVDWLKNDQERVDGLGMNFKVVNAGSAAALWAELKSASKRNAPIVLFNWTPNFIEALYEGKFVEFPAYHEKCRKDPKWGLNPNKSYDCGNPKDGYLKLGVWKDFPKAWPKAYKLMQKMSFSNLDIAVMAKLVDVDKMEAEAAAAKWMKDNEKKWKSWVAAAKM